MKILLLCYEYPPIGGGGGRVAARVASALVRRGHEVRVQTAALGWSSIREEIDGVEVFRTGSGRRAPDTCRVSEMAAYCATSFFPTLEHIREWKPDLMHAHFAMPTGLLALAVHGWTGLPYVLTVHLGDVPGGVPEQTDSLFRWIGPIARRVWSRARAVTAISTFVQELSERAYGRKVIRILNGIDLDGGRGRSRPTNVFSPPRMVFVGRFSEQKQPGLLIEALAKIGGLDWDATLIGDGPHREAVEKQIAESGLGERVRLTGWLGAGEVEDILRQSDILVMPSLSEGLPIAAIEALKHGLAIVGSAIPGLRDVLVDGVNGRVFPVGEASGLGEVLRGLLGDGAALLAMKQASWDRATDFDLAGIVDEYEAVLRGDCG